MTSLQARFRGLADLRQDQTAPGQSLWGSTQLITVPHGMQTAPAIALARVSVPDSQGNVFAVVLDDDPANGNDANRYVEVFFGSEGHQVSSGLLPFPRSRMLNFPGSYIKVIASVAQGTFAGTQTYKLGAHVAYQAVRSGAFWTAEAQNIAAGFAGTFAVPRFARRVRVESNSVSSVFQPYQFELDVQWGGALNTILSTYPKPDLPYLRNLPANAVQLRITNQGTVAQNWCVEWELDF